MPDSRNDKEAPVKSPDNKPVAPEKEPPQKEIPQREPNTPPPMEAPTDPDTEKKQNIIAGDPE